MRIINLSHNDDLINVIRKCNENFKQLTWQLTQSSKTQRRTDSETLTREINSLYQTIGELRDSIPTTVSDAIDEALPQTYPPVGSYILNQFDPSNDYPNTIWQQVDTVTTDGNVTIPLWQRIVI